MNNFDDREKLSSNAEEAMLVNNGKSQSEESASEAPEMLENPSVETSVGTTPEATQDIQKAIDITNAETVPEASVPLPHESAAVPKKKSGKLAVILSGIAACMVIAAGLLIVPMLMKDNDVTPPENTSSLPISEQASSVSSTPVSEAPESEQLVRVLPERSVVTSVVADKMDGGVIATDSSFTITAVEEFSEDELKSRMQIEPKLPYTLEKNDKYTYSVKLSGALAKGSMVKLSFLADDGAERSWAFQTEDVFRLISVLPADGGTEVPENTGIEMKFSFAADKNKAADYFEITPSVEGSFELFRTTLVFVPTKPLETNTLYTVSIKEGLPSLDGPALAEGKTFSFKTVRSSRTEYCYVSNSTSETFLPEDPKVIEIYHSDYYNDKDFNVKLYSYNSADAYYKTIWESIEKPSHEHYRYYSYEYSRNEWISDYAFSVEGLDMVFEETEKVLRLEQGYGYSPSFLMLPDELAEGWYIADITDADKTVHFQKLIQVSTVSVYAATLSQQAAFFVNDTVTGNTVDGAEIKLELDGKTITGTTDASGSSLMNYPESDSYYGALRITYGGKTFIDKLDCNTYRVNQPEADYYMYLYTDREMYLTSDTVKIWGMIKPRTKDSPPIPDDLYIKLGNGDSFGEKADIKLFEDGTFTCEITYKNYNEHSYINVMLMSGEEEFCSKYIIVLDYEKPVYVLDTHVPTTVWMPHREGFTASITASYYDGNAAPGLLFNVKDDKGTSSSVTTDKNGYAEVAVSASDRNTWRPEPEYVSFAQDGIEDNYQHASADYYAYHRDTMLETKFDKETNTLHLSTHKINQVEPTEIFNEHMGYSYYGFDYDAMRGEGTNTTVTGTITRYWWIKYETGSYYDFIQKKTVKEYSYKRQEQVIGTFETDTVNGIGAFEALPLDYPDSYFRIELIYEDSLGQEVYQSEYLYEYSKYYYSVYTQGKRYYELNADDYTFTEGQTINFTLYDGNKIDTEVNGRVFYTLYQRDFISLNSAAAPSFSHKMSADCIPNVYMCAAYFDGKHVFPVFLSANLIFSPAERRLSLDVSADKETYGPSDNANVTVTALDMDGNPAVNAAVSISVVDEAAFAIMNQYADPLSDVFETVYYPSARQFYSYIQHSLDGDVMGEKGGGDGDNALVRRDFKDTAAFLTGTTDESGKVTFTFKLPDNLTSWRATVQAVGSAMDGRLCVGVQKENLIVTLPLFLIPIALDEYVEGDDIAVSATLVGASDENAKITAHLTGAGVDETKTAGSKETMNFGKQPVGKYTILFTATDGVNSDAIELPLSVVETRIKMPITRTFNLEEESIDINPISWPVRLTFRDSAYNFYSYLLDNLSGYNGENLDYRIAQAYADKENGMLSDEEFLEEFNGVTSDGLANLLPYSENDYELTALICTAVPEITDKDKVITAFYEKLDDRYAASDDVACCYMGLAALNEPVMNEVVRLLENPKHFSYNDRLMLCAALSLIGDDADAERFYTKMTANIKLYNSGDKEIAYVSENGDEKTAQGSTRIAMIIASELNFREAEGMARYLYGSDYDDDVIRRDYSLALEQIKFMRTYVFEKVPDSVVEYTSDGETKKLNVTGDRCGAYLRFGEEQLGKADIKLVSGSVKVTARYIGRITEQENEPDVTITKTYSAVDGGELKVGSLVKVVIIARGLEDDDYLRVNDVIPSGARFAYMPHEYTVYNNGQNISGYVYRGEPTEVYYINLVTDGEFVAEGAFAGDYRKSWGISDKQTFTVKPQ